MSEALADAAVALADAAVALADAAVKLDDMIAGGGRDAAASPWSALEKGETDSATATCCRRVANIASNSATVYDCIIARNGKD